MADLEKNIRRCQILGKTYIKQINLLPLKNMIRNHIFQKTFKFEESFRRKHLIQLDDKYDVFMSILIIYLINSVRLEFLTFITKNVEISKSGIPYLAFKNNLARF